MEKQQMEQYASSPTRRRLSGNIVTFGVVALLLVLGVVIPSPYVIEKPGPVLNTLGEITVDGEPQPVITVDGEGPDSDATFNLLTVSVVGSPDKQLGWLELVPALFDSTQELLPLKEMFPEGVTSEDREESNRVLMQSSQTTSVVAALNELGEKTQATVTVAQVVEGSAADGLFQEGDTLLSIDDREITGSAMVQRAVADAPQGREIKVELQRQGTTHTVEVTPEWIDQQQRNVLGIVMSAEYEYDHDIEFDVDRIGGPSAGLIFSLAVVEIVSKESLAEDVVVSATGTIDDGGYVGAIGGLPQKLWAASEAYTDLMIMPTQNCGDLPDTLPKEMEVVAVSTLHEAVKAIQQKRDQGETQGLAQCESRSAQATPIS